jgi:hypothetical protein
MHLPQKNDRTTHPWRLHSARLRLDLKTGNASFHSNPPSSDFAMAGTLVAILISPLKLNHGPSMALRSTKELDFLVRISYYLSKIIL